MSVVSEIARGDLPGRLAGAFIYFAVQGLTFAILVLAANTSYQGFPRLSGVLARDRFFPRQFVNLGDRLVYSNGIIVLAGDRLAPDLGVRRGRERADPPVRDRRLHRLHALADGDGALLARAQGARLAALGDDQRRRAVATRRRRARHRDEVPGGRLGGRRGDPAPRRRLLRDQPPLPEGRRRLRAGAAAVAAAPAPTNQVVLYVDSYDAALREAVWYARTIAGDDFHAIHVPGPRERHRDPPAVPAADEQSARPRDRRRPRTAASTR